MSLDEEGDEESLNRGAPKRVHQVSEPRADAIEELSPSLPERSSPSPELAQDPGGEAGPSSQPAESLRWLSPLVVPMGQASQEGPNAADELVPVLMLTLTFF